MLIDLSDIPIDEPDMISLANAFVTSQVNENNQQPSILTLRHILLDCCDVGEFLDLFSTNSRPYIVVV